MKTRSKLDLIDRFMIFILVLATVMLVAAILTGCAATQDDRGRSVVEACRNQGGAKVVAFDDEVVICERPDGRAQFAVEAGDDD